MHIVFLLALTLCHKVQSLTVEDNAFLNGERCLPLSATLPHTSKNADVILRMTNRTWLTINLATQVYRIILSEMLNYTMGEPAINTDISDPTISA